MSLILATGSNLGDKKKHLQNALEKLKDEYKLIASSRVYESSAVGKTDQPSFFNQVLEFDLPHTEPQETMLRIIRDRKPTW
jgi:2-amino-4-hydroxy-6-hydroxymethyldihydropteridine diphosphokinase